MDFFYSVRRVDRGVCFKSLNECNNHDDCAQNENCCHQHCCPSEYFQKWKTFPCVSDYFCTNSHLGSKCCLDQNQDTKHCYDYESETCMGNDTKSEVVEVLIELVQMKQQQNQVNKTVDLWTVRKYPFRKKSLHK